MSRTKAEVRAFLDSLVGTIVVHPGYPSLNGQCVTLTKALMEFLGVPNPYKARGNAKDAGDTMLREGIGSAGRGWLTVVVNRDMGYIDGVHYGHIWVDLLNESNYESNGAVALHCTKNTRPIQQGQQFVNLDKYIREGDTMEVFKDSNDVRVNGFNLFGIDIAGNNPALMAWVGQSKLDFFKGLGAQVVNNKEAQDKEIERLNGVIANGKTCTADERAFLDAHAKLNK